MVSGGLGGLIGATLDVVPGQKFYVYVGGKGGPVNGGMF